MEPASCAGTILENLRRGQTVMKISQIKDEIRVLSRIDKIEICRWLESETIDELFVRVGVERARLIRQEFERRFMVASPEKASGMARTCKPPEVKTKASDGHAAQNKPGASGAAGLVGKNVRSDPFALDKPIITAFR
jgi:hypothetical protein